MAEDRKKSLTFWQIKGNNSAITDDTPKNLHVHNHTIVIYIRYKFHDILSIGYLIMVEEEKKRKNLGNQRAIKIVSEYDQALNDL